MEEISYSKYEWINIYIKFAMGVDYFANWSIDLADALEL